MSSWLRRNCALLALALAAPGVLVGGVLTTRALVTSSLTGTGEKDAAVRAGSVAHLALAAPLADGRLSTEERSTLSRKFVALRAGRSVSAMAVSNQRGVEILRLGAAPGRATLDAAVPIETDAGEYVARIRFPSDDLRAMLASTRARLTFVWALMAALLLAAGLPLLVRVTRAAVPADAARRLVLQRVRAGLERGELFAHYQPKVDATTRRPLGVEALVRWQHPQRGLLLPGEFMGDVEQDPVVLGALTREVLDQAVRDCARWYGAGYELPVAVNVSAPMLRDRRLIRAVAEALRKHRLESHLLTLEITETAIMEEGATATEVLRELRLMGVRVSLDDFGTGHSSLARLRAFPLDELKLDGCFVRRLAVDERDRALVRLVVEMSHVLGLSVVAEGVEDEPTLALLREIGCNIAQGYLFARPLPADELIRCIGAGLDGARLAA